MDNLYLPEGCILNTRENLEHLSSLQGLEDARKSGIILEARASLCDSDHNLYVDLGKYKGIIPKAEAVFSADGSDIKDIAIITRVGKAVCFVVREIYENDGKTVIKLSRKAAQKMCFENKIKKLLCGDVIDCTVTHLEQFGAFCDIGCGICALMPVDCISVSRISHPGDRFFSGQTIKSVVKSYDESTGRITLSHKELLGTWEQNAMCFCAGETVTGIIRSVEAYGIFVELAPNLAGLAEWCEGIYPGMTAAVYIKSIIPEKMKIKLVIVDASGSGEDYSPIEYFFDGTHLDRWDYSPKNCTKEISTVFSER